MKYKIISKRNSHLDNKIVEILDINTHFHGFIEPDIDDVMVKIIETGELYVLTDQFILKKID